MSTQNNGDGIAALLRGTADAMGHLFGAHLKLARLELMGDARTVGQRIASILCFAILTTLGYAFLALAAVAALQTTVGWTTAFLVMGALHFILGGVGVAIGLRKLKAIDLLDRTTQAATQSVATLSAGESATPDVEERIRVA
jgi:uncharacterized membrane protein YqjE